MSISSKLERMLTSKGTHIRLAKAFEHSSTFRSKLQQISAFQAIAHNLSIPPRFAVGSMSSSSRSRFSPRPTNNQMNSNKAPGDHHLVYDKLDFSRRSLVELKDHRNPELAATWDQIRLLASSPGDDYSP